MSDGELEATGSEVPAAPVLAAGARFQGLLLLHGAARLDGSVVGDVLGADRLYIGPQGRVEGRVEAGEVVVAGVVEGQVCARRRLELCQTARVRGQIETPRLALADGSLLEAGCRAGGPPGRPATSAEPSPSS
jgi:cytoskeletal protein CcmA (bactofilin family)